MKNIWFVYPYGSIPTENSKDMRYVKFGRRLSDKYNCTWWTSNFSNGSKQYRCDSEKTIDVQKNLKIKLIPTRSYKKNISIGRVLFEFSFTRNLRKAWRKEKKPDLIITPGTGMITAFRPVWPLVKRNSIAAIFDIMDVHLINSYMKLNHPILYPFTRACTWFNEKREAGFYHYVQGVTALGRGQLKIAQERTGNRNIPSCLIYNGIFVDQFRDKMKMKGSITLPEKKDGWIWCVYAGNLGPSYDIPSVLKCADLCKESGKKFMFLIAGGGDYKKLCEKCDNDQVFYLGRVDKNELYPLYAKCDIGLSTYTDYSTVDMPDKFYDYTAAGLAIVNSLKGESKEHIERNQLGVQYQGGNPEDLYEKICNFEDKSFLDQCKKNSWDIGEQFDLGKQLDGLVELVDAILK